MDDFSWRRARARRNVPAPTEGAQLRAERKRKSLTLETLAVLAGLNTTALGELEADTRTFTPTIRIRLRDAFSKAAALQPAARTEST